MSTYRTQLERAEEWRSKKVWFDDEDESSLAKIDALYQKAIILLPVAEDFTEMLTKYLEAVDLFSRGRQARLDFLRITDAPAYEALMEKIQKLTDMRS
jgi:hypothetical protein